jgi:hypothetical protein
MSLARGGVRQAAGDEEDRPPRAVVGSQVDTEEQIFGAFDGRILRRFWGFMGPYRRRLVVAVLAVLVFAGSQILIPLIMRLVIDHALVEGALIERAGALRHIAEGLRPGSLQSRNELRGEIRQPDPSGTALRYRPGSCRRRLARFAR